MAINNTKGYTFERYINNPSLGAVYTNRQLYKNMYKDKFDKILLRENGGVKYTVYTDDDGNDSYYIHMKIPSEVISNFYYDVVVRLFTTDNDLKNSNNLRMYSVEFYSNDPAFVYTFAHSFKKNGLFIKDLESKMTKEALKNKAVAKNPKDDVWYVKSLYFAYLTMEKYNLFNRVALERNCKAYNKKVLLKDIVHADLKITARQKAQSDLNEQKRIEKQKEKIKTQRNVNVRTKPSNTSGITKTSKMSKVSKTAKKTTISKNIGMKKIT